MTRRVAALCMAIALSAFAAPPASATMVVFSYAGNPLVGAGPVSGELRIDLPTLDYNASIALGVISSYTLTLRNPAVTQLTLGLLADLGYSGDFIHLTNGQIDAWDIDLIGYRPGPAQGLVPAAAIGTRQVPWSTTDWAESYGTSASVAYANFGDPGTWTRSVIPEPATMLLIAVGLAGIGLTRRSKK